MILGDRILPDPERFTCAPEDDDDEPAIIIARIDPPIPLRGFDYRATREDYDVGDPIGYGPTPQAAEADLLDQEEAQS